MTDRLTDGQLREIKAQCDAGNKIGGVSPVPRWQVESMATELLALRAERAKPTPTPSDEETARKIVYIVDRTMRDDAIVSIKGIIASIRADGSAERAKLEAALKDAAIIAHTMPIQTDPSGLYSDGFKDARNYIADRLDDIIRAALPITQPAESGATEQADGCIYPNCTKRDCTCDAGAKPSPP